MTPPGTFLAAGVCGAVATAAAVASITRRLKGPRHVRTNFRGRQVIATGGLALVAALAVAAAVAAADPDGRGIALVMAGAGLSMGALGFLDDVYGDRSAGGLAGHARALLRGTITTGVVKAAGGVLTGLAAAWFVGWRGVWVLVGGAVVALASNLTNLFDLRPGRAIKLWVPVAIALVAGSSGAPRAVLIGLGAAVLVFLAWELREQVMLGDTGAGLLGAVVGVAALAVLGPTGLAICAGLLLALTLASEVVSFSRVIAAVPPLRFVDRLGRSADPT